MKVSTDACIFGAWMAGVLAARSPGNVLDIGAGTGLLSLMVAQQCSAPITGIELQPSSATQAAANILASPWADRIEIIQGDINEVVFPEWFDAIITNPPFFDGDLRGPEAARNLARHADTLSFAQLLSVFSLALHPNGVAGLLIPYTREAAFIKDAAAAGFHCLQIVRLRQTPKHDYFRSMLLIGKGPEPKGPQKLDWAIPKCTSLLKDYYLYL